MARGLNSERGVRHRAEGQTAPALCSSRAPACCHLGSFQVCPPPGPPHDPVPKRSLQPPRWPPGPGCSCAIQLVSASVSHPRGEISSASPRPVEWGHLAWQPHVSVPGHPVPLHGALCCGGLVVSPLAPQTIVLPSRNVGDVGTCVPLSRELELRRGRRRWPGVPSRPPCTPAALRQHCSGRNTSRLRSRLRHV